VHGYLSFAEWFGRRNEGGLVSCTVVEGGSSRAGILIFLVDFVPDHTSPCLQKKVGFIFLFLSLSHKPFLLRDFVVRILAWYSASSTFSYNQPVLCSGEKWERPIGQKVRA
jgi:hypothetical protein